MKFSFNLVTLSFIKFSFIRLTSSSISFLILFNLVESKNKSEVISFNLLLIKVWYAFNLISEISFSIFTIFLISSLYFS